MTTEHFGIVKDVIDPKKLGRIKVEIPGKTHGIEKEVLPWYNPILNKGEFDLPAINETVLVFLDNDDIMHGTWKRYTRGTQNLKPTDNDYESAKIMLHRDLAENQDEGILSVRYLKSEGFKIILEDTMLWIRKEDKSIALYNTQTDKWIDISKESISLGSETKSAEPGVLGDKNHDSLDQLADSVQQLSDLLNNHLTKLSTAANSSPYTMHLVPILKAAALEIKTKMTQTVNKMKNYFPKTLSKVVTLD